jgi:plasmid maintenance system antidote protein VapI
MSEDRIAELERVLAAETGRANRILHLLNRQTWARMRMQQALDRYANDVPEYRHALGHVVECDDNCHQCRRLAQSALDQTVEFGSPTLTPVTYVHPPWQVQMERNDDGTYDVGLDFAGRTGRMNWGEATSLSVALKVAVENAAATDGESRADVDAIRAPADSDPSAPFGSGWDELIPFDPDWVVSPGAMLKEWAEDHDLDPRAAAERVNLGIAAYLDLEAGTLLLTEEIAEDLERGTDIKAEMWLAMERIYRDGLAEGKTHVSTVEGEHGGPAASEPAGPPPESD